MARRWIYLSLILIVLIGFSLQSVNADNITSCSRIKDPGEYYLQNSIKSPLTCMEIRADNVLLDCQNHEILYDLSGKEESYGIDNSRGYKNVTIRNCKIVQGASNSGSHAIYYEGNDNGNIINNEIITLGSGSSGIYFKNSDSNSIYYNTIRTNARLIFLFNSKNNLFYNNLLNSSTNNSGVYFPLATNNYWNSSVGNYWTNFEGKGYSDTCNNSNPRDDICDEEYKIGDEVFDYIPITHYQNSPPIISDVSISPETAYTDNDLICSVEASDPDNDTLIYYFEWRNGVDIISINISNNSYSLTSDNTASGQTWTCFVTANDGFENSEIINTTKLIISPPLPPLKPSRSSEGSGGGYIIDKPCEWDCSEWSECSLDIQYQTRICKPIRNCTGEVKPKEIQYCPTVLEEPEVKLPLIETESKTNYNWLMTAITGISSLGVVTLMFHQRKIIPPLTKSKKKRKKSPKK